MEMITLSLSIESSLTRATLNIGALNSIQQLGAQLASSGVEVSMVNPQH
jgi:hypothetical protein